MPVFAANISLMFRELPFLERFAAAGRAGFPAVECHFPYEHPISDVARAMRESGVRLTGINTAPGDVSRGDWGLACDAGRRVDFLAGVDQALEYAVALDVPAIHVMAGMTGGMDPAAARESYLAAMAAAADRAAAAGRTVLTEPLNSRDRPGYFLARSDEAAALIREIGRPNLKLMFDVYHIQIMEGDITGRLKRHFPLIGHVQIAGVPARQEPDTGEVNYAHVFAVLAELGWNGLVGAEYVPAGRTEDGLGWMRALA
jgi:hydroxypyruvate isomerase